MDFLALLRRVLLCPLGRHERSRGKAKLDGPDIMSVCRYCGVPMRKDMDDGWVVDRKS